MGNQFQRTAHLGSGHPPGKRASALTLTLTLGEALGFSLSGLTNLFWWGPDGSKEFRRPSPIHTRFPFRCCSTDSLCWNALPMVLVVRLHLAVLIALALRFDIGLCIRKDLLRAIDENNPAMCNIALKAGASPDAVGEDGDSALMHAIRKDKHKAVKALLRAGASKQTLDAGGYSLSHVGCHVGAFRSVQLLLTDKENGMDDLHEDGLAPMHRAILGGHTHTVKALLNAGVPSDMPTADGRKPMELASSLAMREVLTKFARPSAKEEV